MDPFYIFEICLTAYIFFFFGRFFFFFAQAYPALGWGPVFALVFLGLHTGARTLFQFEPILHTDMADYYLSNQFTLFTLPFLIASLAVYVFCFSCLRKSAYMYSWQDNTLNLFKDGSETLISSEEIASTTSATCPVILLKPYHAPKVFKIITSKGIFVFDEMLEKSHWETSEKVPFWSISAGLRQANRNWHVVSDRLARNYFKKNI